MQVNIHVCVHASRGQKSTWSVFLTRLASELQRSVFLSPTPRIAVSHIWLFIDMNTGDLDIVPHAYAVDI